VLVIEVVSITCCGPESHRLIGLSRNVGFGRPLASYYFLHVTHSHDDVVWPMRAALRLL
jgi:hypothetical protein